MSTIKCFKCRTVLLKPEETEVLTAHGDLRIKKEVSTIPCDSILNCKLLYLKYEILPDWISSKIEESSWMKGKLNCESCKSKIGSFDFVSGRQCACGDAVLPAVYFVGSQVDWIQN